MSKVLTDQIEKRTGGTAMDVPTTGKWPTANIADDAITATQIADDAITLAKQAAGTQGGTVYYGAAGAPTELAAGTSGQFLKTQGAGQNPTWGTVTEYNDTKILNDIGTLALHSSIGMNQAAYNLSNAFVDTYQDNTGVDTTTQCAVTGAEYVATIYSIANSPYVSDPNTLLLMHSPATAGVTTFTDSSSNDMTITKLAAGTIISTTAQVKTGINATSYHVSSGSASLEAGPIAGFADLDGDFCIDYWQYGEQAANVRVWSFEGTGSQMFCRANSNQSPYYGLHTFSGTGQVTWNVGTNYFTDAWHHSAHVRDGDTYRWYADGIQRYSAAVSGTQSWSNTTLALNIFGNAVGGEACDSSIYLNEFRVSDVVRFPSGTTFTPGTSSSNYATGNYTSTTETAQATVSKMSIIMLYKNNAGTNTLNTDLVAQISADGGSNYQTVTLTAGGTFSTGILIAKADNVTISTTGTAPKYKISFANQSSGVKEAQVHGVALLY